MVLLAEMLHSDELRKQDASVKCLEVMSTSEPHHWKDILDSGSSLVPFDIVSTIVSLLVHLQAAFRRSSSSSASTATRCAQ